MMGKLTKENNIDYILGFALIRIMAGVSLVAMLSFTFTEKLMSISNSIILQNIIEFMMSMFGIIIILWMIFPYVLLFIIEPMWKEGKKIDELETKIKKEKNKLKKALFIEKLKRKYFLLTLFIIITILWFLYIIITNT